MTSTGHYDSDRALDAILAAGEAEELERIRAGLRLDTGLAAITHGSSAEHPPRPDADDSGEPQILPEPSPSRASPQARLDGTRRHDCVLFAVDVAGFTRHRRDDDIQLYMREALYRILTQAFEASNLGWDNCLHEDRGDGVLVIVPSGMRSAMVVDPLLDRLRAGLRHHNRVHTERARIQLRVAVHSGPVVRDEHGVSGAALTHVFRLLDAPVLRRALASSEDDLALIVSDHFYDTVIRQAPGMTDPGTFHPARVAVKETRARGWLHIPASSQQPPQPPSSPWETTSESRSSEELEELQSLADALAAPEILSFRWIPGGR
jgi:class 3 adenylate cyclase